MIERIDFTRAKELLDTREGIVMLDVREEEEFITGHPAEAVLLPLGDIDAAMAAAVIPTLTTPIIVYCRSGRRSAEAAEKLQALGYSEIYDVGGLIGWPYGLLR